MREVLLNFRQWQRREIQRDAARANRRKQEVAFSASRMIDANSGGSSSILRIAFADSFMNAELVNM
jgi:hypothetical protein